MGLSIRQDSVDINADEGSENRRPFAHSARQNRLQVPSKHGLRRCKLPPAAPAMLTHPAPFQPPPQRKATTKTATKSSLPALPRRRDPLAFSPPSQHPPLIVLFSILRSFQTPTLFFLMNRTPPLLSARPASRTRMQPSPFPSPLPSATRRSTQPLSQRSLPSPPPLC
jgi:hypothetical protein